MIRQGSIGQDVVAWQRIIGVTADGQFGPATAAATRTWQAAHGVTADGVVGPQTWAVATAPTVASGDGLDPSALAGVLDIIGARHSHGHPDRQTSHGHHG